MSSGPRQTMPSMSFTLIPESAMALRIASTRRSRLDTPGTRPSRLCPAPTIAQASRSAGDGSIIVASFSQLAGQFAQARRKLRRRGIDTIQQRVDFRTGDRIDLHSLRLGVLQQFLILDRGIEGGA